MIGHAFTLKQLEALVWVADLGSFRKAAAHLNTTQPNISSRIAGLEDSLGVILMQRDAGSVRLTDKGREIVAAARATLRQAEQLVTVAARPDLIADRLRLGVTELVACTWLHAYLRALKSAYPGVTVELTVDLSRNLDKDLSSRALDLTVQTAPFASPASGIVELGDFPYVWVSTGTILSRLPDRPTVADLLPHSILTHARHTRAYQELTDHATAHGLSMARIAPSNSMASCVQMAQDDMGVALLPRALVEKEIAEQSLQVVAVDWHPSPLRFAARYQAERVASYVARCAALAVDALADYTAARG